MLDKRVQNVLQYLAWLILFLFLAYAGMVALVYQASKPYSKYEAKVDKLVKQTAITQVDEHYHLDRGVVSYSASGTTKKGKQAYIIYLPKSSKAYYYTASDGVSESSVKDKFAKTYPKKQIRAINLGWKDQQAVWEVAATNADGSYCYAVYKFKDGNLLSLVDNL